MPSTTNTTVSSATADLNIIPATQYDIYSKLLYIASKYTDIQNEDFLRSGLFGYITESMAMIMRDSSIHKTMLYNESFLNTAIIPKSIYNWSKMFNIEVTSATPAYADITITINENDFNNYKKPASSYGEDVYGSEITSYGEEEVLIIDKSNNFIAGQYNFMLEHSILLRQNSNGRGYFAKYLDGETNETTNYQEYTTPILQTVYSSDGYGENYISISARVYQYSIQNQTKIIASTSFIDRKVHEFEFTNQFVKATCTYTKNGTSPITLYYSNITGIDENTDYAFYSLTDSNKLQIKFPDGIDSFRPAANSELGVSIITTLGAGGNISYTGDVICRLNEEDLRNLPLVVSFTNGKASGGLNAPSLSEIKQKIINEISTRDTIVTETDLNNYFAVLKSLLETVNQGQVKFVKKRDDILRRIFTAYILLKDTEPNTSYIPPDIQTNTVDVEFMVNTNQALSFGQQIIQDGSTFSCNPNIQNAELAATGKSTYMVPFYLYVCLNPIRRVKYIYNLANDSTSLSFRDVTNTTGTNIIIPSSVKVYRGFSNSAADDSYKFTFTLTTNFDMSNAQTGNSGYLGLSFRSHRNNATIISQTLSYSLPSTAVEIVSSEADAETGTRTTTITITIPVNSPEFNFASNSGTSDTNQSSDNGSYINLRPANVQDPITSLLLPEDVVPILEFNNVTVNDQTISMSFEGDSVISLFKNLDDIMSSDIIVNYKDGAAEGTTDINSVIIKDVPILNQEFVTTQEKLENFISQLFIYINMLKENLQNLETNTFFDLKFFNTSGLSQYYNTHNTELDLQLRIRLKETLSPLNYALDIRKYVRSLVDQANNEGTIKISHIIASTVAKFYDLIESVDFEGLNGTFTQYIKPTTFLGTESNKKLQFTPEHLNIPDKYMKDIIITSYDGESVVIDYDLTE